LLYINDDDDDGDDDDDDDDDDDESWCLRRRKSVGVILDSFIVHRKKYAKLHRVSEKTPTHIIGYKLRSSCLILIIFDTNIPHIIWHHMTA